MRIPIWPGVRLSVWERQNPAAVQVVLARSTPYEPVRRVLSSRGWMLLWVRYDWRDYSLPKPAPDPRAAAFREAGDVLQQIDPVGFREAAEVCESLALRAEREGVPDLDGGAAVARAGKALRDVRDRHPKVQQTVRRLLSRKGGSR